MKEYISDLQKTSLFSDIKEDELAMLFDCLQAKAKTFQREEYVIRRGEVISSVMMLVRGELHIQREDYWGNRSIVNRVGEGEMFGEAYAAPQSGPIRNDVIAVKDSEILFFDIHRLLTICPSACRFHAQMVQNLFIAVAQKNRQLVQKMGHLSKRSTREKLISYLSEEAQRQGTASFAIPFNRQQLADFLLVDRCAMSKELCKMRDEGMLEFRRNCFVLKETAI